MSFTGFSFTQPFFRYVEEVEYNVVPATVELLFSAPPSHDVTDYISEISGISFEVPVNLKFSSVDGTIEFSGNSVILTLPVTLQDDGYIKISYQGSYLPFILRANNDPSHETPAIIVDLNLVI